MRNRTGYSFRRAYGFVEQVVAQIDTPYAAITDFGSAFAYNEWKRQCERVGKKPLFGIELGLTHLIEEKDPPRTSVVLFSTDRVRWTNEAYEKATSQFKFEPLLTYGDLAKLHPSIVVMPGRGVRLKDLPEGVRYVMPFGPSTLRREIEWAVEKGVPIVPASDNRYPTPDDREAYLVLAGRLSSAQTWDQHILKHEDFLAMGATPEMFEAAESLSQEICSVLPVSHTFNPKGAKDIRVWCQEGAISRGLDVSQGIYHDRLQRELEVIEGKGYQGYFQIIGEMTEYARKNMIVGPARGSSAGSLVCYLIGITNVDPIVHDLVFERFLDPGRTDLPDIDIDFDNTRREEIFRFYENKYGADHVCRLGAAAFYRAKSVANEVGPLLEVPPWKLAPLIAETESVAAVTKISETLRRTETGRRLLAENPKLEIMDKLDGHPTHATTHASGLVVTDEPVSEYLAIDNKHDRRANIEKDDTQVQNILKIDVLGLVQLSMFQDTLDLIFGTGYEDRKEGREWLQNLPLNDQKAFDVLNEGKFSGIFQWEGAALQRITKQFKVDRFDDLSAVTSLARPGPLGSGGTDRWIRIRTGQETPYFAHECLRPILEYTGGMVIYQEDLMRVGREIGNMNWARVTKLRKVTQYYLGKGEMDEFRIEFVAGALTHGMTEKQANDFWDEMLSFASYSFNKSHAVSYAMISYYCCYLKAHFPVEYAAGVLSNLDTGKEQKMLQMLREMRDEGIEYIPVSPQSGMKWQVIYDEDTKKLLGPITMLSGVGTKNGNEYILAREEGRDLPTGVQNKLDIAKTKIDSLNPVAEAIARNFPEEKGGLEAINIFNKPENIADLGKASRRDVMVFGIVVKATGRKDEKNGGEKLTCVIRDDTGEMRFFIGSKNYDRLGRKLLENSKIGDSIWAIKGTLAEGGDMIFVDIIRSLGSVSGEDHSSAKKPKEEDSPQMVPDTVLANAMMDALTAK